MWNNKLTFLNSAVALKQQNKPDIKVYSTPTNMSRCNLFSLASSTGTNAESNPDLAPPGGQLVYRKGLTTGNTVTSNSRSESCCYPDWAFIRTTTIPKTNRRPTGKMDHNMTRDDFFHPVYQGSYGKWRLPSTTLTDEHVMLFTASCRNVNKKEFIAVGLNTHNSWYIVAL